MQMEILQASYYLDTFAFASRSAVFTSFSRSSPISIAKSKKHTQKGLTLIEVLIALAIVSIAITAAIKASSQAIRSTQYLQQKTIALWLATEVMNEARVNVLRLPEAPDGLKQQRQILGQNLYVRAHQAATPNKRINKLSVAVFTHEEDDDDVPLLNLVSYVYDKKE